MRGFILQVSVSRELPTSRAEQSRARAEETPPDRAHTDTMDTALLSSASVVEMAPSNWMLDGKRLERRKRWKVG